jgi:hypothetical protein
VVERLGLIGLMTLQCDYDPQFILQFYATLAFTGDDDMMFKWMTGTHYCESSFTRFAALLGYPFDGPTTPIGHRIHTPLPVNKNLLYDLYGPKGVPSQVAGLLPLYDLLVHIFRENIAPSGGNNDAIRTSSVDLLIFAHGCAQSTDRNVDFSLDVMDFIFNEMYDAMVSKGSLPYAPFIMRLCRCSGYRGIPVHLLLGPIIGPSSAQGRTNDPSYGEDPHEEVPHEENDGQNC